MKRTYHVFDIYLVHSYTERMKNEQFVFVAFYLEEKNESHNIQTRRFDIMESKLILR